MSLPSSMKIELHEHPIKRELATKGTYHCRVAGVEWGLDALLFSFSSSVKGKKKELTSVGKSKRSLSSQNIVSLKC